MLNCVLRSKEEKIDIVKTVLDNRGIKEGREFLFPKYNPTDFSETIEMLLAVESIIDRLDTKFCFMVDSDCDGFTSSALLYSYFKNDLECQCDFYVHEFKTHNVSERFIEYLINNRIETLVIADAGTNDIEAITEIKKHGIEVYVLDHHSPEIGKCCKDVCYLVNNQMIHNMNKNFTGATVAYMFIECISKRLGLIPPTHLLDLSAIGTIADSAIISDIEIRGYLFEGMKNVQNEYIKRVTSLNEINPKNVGFEIAPVINAVTRFGTLEDRILLFLALTYVPSDDNSIMPVTRKRKNKKTKKMEDTVLYYDFMDYAIETLKKCKSRQDSAVKKQMKTFEPTPHQVQITFGKNDGTSGLLANKIKNQTGCPTLVLYKAEDGLYKGSGRGSTEVFKDFKEWCQQTGVFQLAQGHPNAFGIEVKEEDVATLKHLASKVKSNGNDITEIKVDYEYNLANYNELEELMEDVEKIADLGEIWGKGCEEPLFHIKNVEVQKSLISYKAGYLRMITDEFVLIRPFTKMEVYNELVGKGFDPTIYIDITAKFKQNNYGGKISYQLEMQDIEKINQPTVEVADSKDFGMSFFS